MAQVKQYSGKPLVYYVDCFDGYYRGVVEHDAGQLLFVGEWQDIDQDAWVDATDFCSSVVFCPGFDAAKGVVQLLAVSRQGFHFGKPINCDEATCIGHQALVGLLSAFLSSNTSAAAFGSDPITQIYTQDSFRGVIRLLETFAWKIGVCSWNDQHEPIEIGKEPRR